MYIIFRDAVRLVTYVFTGNDDRVANPEVNVVKSFQILITVIICSAILLLHGCTPQTGGHQIAPAYRPHSENALVFLQQLEIATLAVYPSIIRTLEGTSFSTQSQQQIIELLNEAQLNSVVAESKHIDPGVLKGQSQWEMFVNDKQSIVEYLKQRRPDAQYSLIMELLFQPGNDAIFGIHCYIFDPEGENAFSFLLNSHHQLFVDAKLIAGDSTTASRALLIEKATQVGVTAFIQQVTTPLVKNGLEQDAYTITTRNVSAFDGNVEKVFVATQFHGRMISVFMHSFKHSLKSAFESNGVDAIVKVAPKESDTLVEFANDLEAFSPDATMLIIIDPLYRKRKDGYEAVVGTIFEVSLLNSATGKEAWHANGKVDYIGMFGANYTAHEGIRKEFAWHTTAAIIRAFMADVNGQKSVPIYTVTEDRQFYGQRTD